LMVSIVPSTSLIDLYRQRKLPWELRLQKFIDTAFDAEATRVAFVFSQETLTVTDDGFGCPTPVDLLRFQGWPGRPGRPAPIPRLGGIGMGDVAVTIADEVEIRTTHDGIRHTVKCDWPAVEKRGLWKLKAPTVEEVGGHGTEIILRSLTAALPDDWTN